MIQKLDTLIGRLVIVDVNVKNEAMEQPMLFIQAARYRVARMRDVSRAKSELEATMSGLSLVVRAKGRGQERMTEGYVKARILKNPKTKLLQRALQKAEEREEFSRLLLEAFRMRRDAIRIIAEMQNYEGIRGTAEVERLEQNRKLANTALKLHRRQRLTGED